MTTESMRRCRRCCQVKVLSEYDKNPGHGDGWRKWCRACTQLDPEYRIYVVELSDDVGPREDSRYPHVYVGQTSTQVECRYWQHKNKINSSPTVRRFGTHLRPDLYEPIAPVATQTEAEALEQATMKDLRSRGFTVHGG